MLDAVHRGHRRSYDRVGQPTVGVSRSRWPVLAQERSVAGRFPRQGRSGDATGCVPRRCQELPVRCPDPRLRRGTLVASSRRSSETRNDNPDSVLQCHSMRTRFLHRCIVSGVEGACDIDVHAAGSCRVGMVVDAGVLTDRETEPPPVYDEHRWFRARREALGFRVAQPHLPIPDATTVAADDENRDVLAGPIHRRYSHESYGTDGRACIHDGRQPFVAPINRFSHWPFAARSNARRAGAEASSTCRPRTLLSPTT